MLAMIPGDNKETDPDKLAKLLELELMKERMAWQRKKAKGNSLRLASFVFLFLVIFAALAGAIYIFSQFGGDQAPLP